MAKKNPRLVAILKKVAAGLQQARTLADDDDEDEIRLIFNRVATIHNRYSEKRLAKIEKL